MHRISSTASIKNDIVVDEQKRILGEFRLSKVIGEGTFGKVIMALHDKTGEKVAIKILSKKSIIQNNDTERVYREITILKSLHHINICQLYYVIETTKYICLVIEYCNGKDLGLLFQEKKYFSEFEVLEIFSQLVSTLDYLHKFNIAHRDIKLENILITKEGVLKIIDFGLSNIYSYENKEVDFDELETNFSFLNFRLNFLNEISLNSNSKPITPLKTSCGSPSYAAPEIILGEKYNPMKADIWSAGICLYFLLVGQLPFHGHSEKELFDKITRGLFDIPLDFPSSIRSLLLKLIHVNPQKRISIEELKKHEWLCMYISDNCKGLMNGVIPPLDNEILLVIDEYFLTDIVKRDYMNKIISDIIMKKHNEHTSLYYLLVKKKANKKGVFISKLNEMKEKDSVKEEESSLGFYYNFIEDQSISDFSSQMFNNYVKQPKNKLVNLIGYLKDFYSVKNHNQGNNFNNENKYISDKIELYNDYCNYNLTSVSILKNFTQSIKKVPKAKSSNFNKYKYLFTDSNNIKKKNPDNFQNNNNKELNN